MGYKNIGISKSNLFEYVFATVHKFPIIHNVSVLSTDLFAFLANKLNSSVFTKLEVTMSQLEDIKETKLQYIISHQFRKQETHIQTIPFVLSQIILAYVESISRSIHKRNNSNKFEIKSLIPSKWKLKKYPNIEFQLTDFNFMKKISIGVSKPITNSKQKLQNNPSFGGLFITKNAIFQKEKGLIQHEYTESIKPTDIIKVKHNIANGNWSIYLQEPEQKEERIFDLTYNLPTEHYQLSVCLFDNTDSVCVSHIYGFRNQKINRTNNNDDEMDIEINSTRSVIRHFPVGEPARRRHGRRAIRIRMDSRFPK